MNATLLRTCVLVTICAFAPHANAQNSSDPVDRARIQAGPLGLTPSISLTNLGIDSNVFNQVDDARRDFTFTLSPRMDVFFRAGRSRLELNARADVIYFREYSSERSLDGDIDGRWEIRWNRLTPWVAAGRASGRQRVGYEIDARSRREVTDYAVGLEARVASKTRISATAQRMSYSYDAGAVFSGTTLREVLNRETDSVGVQYRQALTPLTTFVVHGETRHDRFEYAPIRDGRSVRLQAGFDLGDRALIFGRGRVGYRQFRSEGGALRDFSGIVASYGVGTTLMGRTRIDVSGERDIEYSYQLEYPYFVLSGATVTVTPRLSDSWDIQSRVGAQWLAYRAQEGIPEGIPAALADRTDAHRLFGAGVGYYLGRDIRVGFNVDRVQRTSAVQSRDYEGYRMGTSITYGR